MRYAICWALLSSGCLFDAPAPRQRRDAATPAARDAAIAPPLPDLAPAIVAPPATPPVEEERPWDGCAQHDPNPWPWRDDGTWGEDPAKVPSFSLEQERRAPKMPDADRSLHGAPASRVRTVEDGLLICEVESYSHDGLAPVWYRYKLGRPPRRPDCGSDWDTFAGPDAMLRFRLRDDYPLTLFGPEDHWGFFISVPRVSLRAGDQLAVKMWDRDAGTTFTSAKPESQRNEYMGQGKLLFDGKLPFTIRTDFFRMRCNLLPSAAAHARAQPWIARLERGLKAAENWRPDRDRWGFSDNQHASFVTSEFGRENFRYAAGFVGWDDAAIQSRLPRLEAIAAADLRKRGQLVERLIAAAAATDGSHPLPAGRGALKFAAAGCHQGQCTVELEVGARAAADLCRFGLWPPGLRIATVDGEGLFQDLAIERPTGDDRWQPCSRPSGTPAGWSAHNRLRGRFPDGAKLLWIGGLGKALIFRPPPEN